MVELPPLAAVFYVGLLISALIFFCVLGILWALKHSAVRRVGASFLREIAQREVERGSSFKNWLHTGLGYGDDEVDAVVQQFLKQETAFFQALRLCTIQQNETSFKKMNGQYGKLKELFQKVEPQQNTVAEVDPELLLKFETESAELKLQTDTLENEKNELIQQLAVANDTMNSVVDEYTMMFGQKGDQDALQESKTKMILILDQLTEKMGQSAAGATPAG